MIKEPVKKICSIYCLEDCLPVSILLPMFNSETDEETGQRGRVASYTTRANTHMHAEFLVAELGYCY